MVALSNLLKRFATAGMTVVVALALLGAAGVWFRQQEPIPSDGAGGSRHTSGTDYGVSGTITTSAAPIDLTTDGDSLLVSSAPGLVQRIDPSDGAVKASFDLGSPVGVGLLARSDEIVVPLVGASSLAFLRSDLGTAQRLQVRGGKPQNGAATADGYWFSCTTETAGSLLHVSGRKEVSRVSLKYNPYSLAVNGNYLYIAFTTSDAIGRLNVDTGELITAQVKGYPVDVAVVNGRLWITLGKGKEIAIADLDTLQVMSRHPVGDEPWKLAVGLGSVWVTNQRTSTPGAAGTVSRLDPATGERQQPDIAVGVKPDELSVGADAVYVANSGEKSLSVLRLQ